MSGIHREGGLNRAVTIHRRKVADLVRAMTQEDDAGMAREGSGT
jgi:hypothetical protein